MYSVIVIIGNTKKKHQMRQNHYFCGMYTKYMKERTKEGKGEFLLVIIIRNDNFFLGLGDSNRIIVVFIFFQNYLL